MGVLLCAKSTFSFIVVVLMTSTTATAIKIAVVDFQKAINQVKEGKKTVAELDNMMSIKRQELAKQEATFKAKQDYEKQQTILSAGAQKNGTHARSNATSTPTVRN